MEAIECSHAEAWLAPLTPARWVDLPVNERVPQIDDFAVARGAVAVDALVDWAPATRLDGGVRVA